MHNTGRKFRNNEKGSALVGVLCVMCVFAAIALSMLFAAYQVLGHSQKIMTKEQCHVLADTFSEQVNSEITNAADDTTGLRNYIKASMTDDDSWGYFDADEDGHAKQDVIKMIDAQMNSSEATQKAGTLQIGLYWKRTGSSAEYKDRILVAEVTAKLRGEQYQIVNEYRLTPESGVDGAPWVWYVNSARSGGETS